MKVKDLKKKLEKVDDDLEVFVSPLVEMKVLEAGDELNETRAPTPFERYKITNVIQAGAVGRDGVYDLCLLFAYDDLVNYSKENEDDGGEFIN